MCLIFIRVCYTYLSSCLLVVLVFCYLFFCVFLSMLVFFFFQAEDGIRYLVRSRGLGDVYKRQLLLMLTGEWFLRRYFGAY